MKLRKRDNGFYYIIYDGDHRRSLKTQDKDEAMELFEAEKAEIRAGRIVDFEKKSRITLVQFKEEYLKEREKAVILGSVVEGTLKNDTLAFGHFIDALGNIPVRKVDKSAIDTFKMKLLVARGNNERRMNGVNVLLRCLRAAFSYAVGKEYIAHNPFFKEIGKKSSVLFDLGKKQPRFLSLGEIRAIRTVLARRIKTLRKQRTGEMSEWERRQYADRLKAARELVNMIYFFLYSGLRRSELVRLQWPDIKLDSNVIHVMKTKTKVERYVPITDDLRNLVARMGVKDIGSVFPRWRSPETISRLFKSIAEEAGVDKTLHTTRHSFGSYLAMSGAHSKAIQKAMGHSDLKTTEIYMHIADDSLQSEIKKLKYRGGK